MTIQRILPFAAVLLLGGCVSGYTYQSGDGRGDYYYGNPHVEYRYHTPTGVYGAYSPYGYYGGPYSPYGYYGGVYGGWGGYGYSPYYNPGPRYYHGPYVYGRYGVPYGYSHPQRINPRYANPYANPYGNPYANPNHAPYHGRRPNNPYNPGPTFPQTVVTPPPPSASPTPVMPGSAAERRSERAKIRSGGDKEE